MSSSTEFSTYVFVENHLKTNDQKVARERPLYIGILIFLIGACLYLLDISFATYFLASGAIVMTIGRITMSGRRASIGHRPLKLRLTPDAIYIGDEKLEIKSKSDVKLRIIGYRSQAIRQRTAYYQTHSGNENEIRIVHQSGVAEFNFILDSERHQDQLLHFCKVNGFNVQRS